VTLPVGLRAEAEAEFDEAFDWYDARQAGLEPAFAAEVQRAFDRIAANPLIHRVVFADIRKAVVRGSRIASTTDPTRIAWKSSLFSTRAGIQRSGKTGPDLS
jgi:plasmid stabilization system protein ParE